MPGHKTHLNKFRKIGITQSIFSGHNGFKLEISNRKLAGKLSNTEVKFSQEKFNNILN